MVQQHLHPSLHAFVKYVAIHIDLALDMYSYLLFLAVNSSKNSI